MSNFTEREDLLKNICSTIQNMENFLGNLIYPTSFEQRSYRNSVSYAFRNVKSKKEQLVTLFGEVASATHGTRIGAAGNHYHGKPGEVRRQLISYTGIL